MLHEKGLVVPIQRAVRERNIPYIGWSAGCNVATPTIRTTNDMPVRCSVVMPSLGLFLYKLTRTILMPPLVDIWAKLEMSVLRSFVR